MQNKYSVITNEIGIIEVSGSDCKIFLQGQLTNDINLLDTQNCIFAAHLNNKGRMLASFIVTKIDTNNYYLITCKNIIHDIIPRLKMFILRAKVTINELVKHNILFSQQKATEKPLPLSNTRTSAEVIVKLPFDTTITISDNLAQTIAPITNITTLKNGVELWKMYLINNKIPFIYKTTSAEFVPQHVNYDKLDAISFTKGCYTGQEIVARTHYLGNVKKSLYKFECAINNVQIGQEIVDSAENGQVIGMIVEATSHVINNATISIGLVCLPIKSITSTFLKDGTQLIIET